MRTFTSHCHQRSLSKLVDHVSEQSSTLYFILCAGHVLQHLFVFIYLFFHATAGVAKPWVRRGAKSSGRRQWTGFKPRYRQPYGTQISCANMQTQTDRLTHRSRAGRRVQMCLGTKQTNKNTWNRCISEVSVCSFAASFCWNETAVVLSGYGRLCKRDQPQLCFHTFIAHLHFSRLHHHTSNHGKILLSFG